MEKYQEVMQNILDVMQEFGYKNYNKVAVEIYGKLTYLTEPQIRALQIIAAREARKSDKAFQEFAENVILYNGPRKGHKRDKSDRIIHIRKNGCLQSPFEDGFMNLCDDMAMHLIAYYHSNS